MAAAGSYVLLLLLLRIVVVVHGRERMVERREDACGSDDASKSKQSIDVASAARAVAFIRALFSLSVVRWIFLENLRALFHALRASR
jgi:hypothetical protein